MKRKKILSILLASAMIGTAPASAWAADFTDTNVVDAEEVTEEATEEDVPEQQEDDAESIDLEADDAEDLSQDEDAAAVSTQESEDPFSAGEAVRETGGLKDTVIPYNEFEGTGTGFSFVNYNAHEMHATIRYADSLYYYNKRECNKLVDRAMAADFSWNNSARQYEEMYNWLIGE